MGTGAGGGELTEPLFFCVSSVVTSLRGTGIGFGLSGMEFGLLTLGDCTLLCSLSNDSVGVLLTGVFGGGGLEGMLT